MIEIYELVIVFAPALTPQTIFLNIMFVKQLIHMYDPL